jgi:hypothetical protein
MVGGELLVLRLSAGVVGPVPLGAGVQLLAQWCGKARLAGIAVESDLSFGDTPLVGHPAEARGGRLRGRIFLGRFLATGISG